MYCIDAKLYSEGLEIKCAPITDIASAVGRTLRFFKAHSNARIQVRTVGDQTHVLVRAASRGGAPVPHLRFRCSHDESAFLAFFTELLGGLQDAQFPNSVTLTPEHLDGDRLEPALLAACTYEEAPPAEAVESDRPKTTGLPQLPPIRLRTVPPPPPRRTQVAA